MGLREDKKRELRARILETTLALFGNQGFGSTRVSDIAAQLRISEATFFNYFPTKHAVLDEALREAVDAAVTRALAQRADGEMATLRDIGTQIAAEFASGRPLGLLLGRHPELVSAAVFAELPPPTLLGFFTDVQARGVVRTDLPAELLSSAFLAVVWVAARDRFGMSQRTLVEALHQGVDLFVGGLHAG